jgi:uncharacterized protein YbdZ (MbtH family)
MSKIESAAFAIIVNEERQFGVWSMRRKLPPGWIYAGPTGTRAEMQKLVRQRLLAASRA